MMSTRKIAFNIGIRDVVKVTKMKDIRLMLTVLFFGLGVLTVLGASQDENALWDLGSADDFLSSGPVYHSGPFFYPNSDLSLGTQRFLDNYPSYMPPGYSNYPNYNLAYNPAYKPVVLGNWHLTLHRLSIICKDTATILMPTTTIHKQHWIML